MMKTLHKLRTGELPQVDKENLPKRKSTANILLKGES